MQKTEFVNKCYELRHQKQQKFELCV